jgi:hypothetical protein
VLTIKIGEVVWVPVPSFVSVKRGTGSAYVRCGPKRELGVVSGLPNSERDGFTILLRDGEMTQASAHQLWPVVEYTREQVFQYLQSGGVIIAADDLASLINPKKRVRSDREVEAMQRRKGT